MNTCEKNDELFALRPRPELGELLNSYIGRLLNFNGFSGLRGLTVGSPSARESKLEFLQQHAALREAELGYLIDPGHIVFEAKEDRKLFLTAQVRWCTRCVAERPMFLGHWIFRTTVVCIKHRLFLLDECPSCRSPQTDRSVPGQCKCGVMLTQAHEEVVPDPLYRLQQGLYQSFFCEGKRSVFGLDYFKAAKLAHYLGVIACSSHMQSLQENASSRRIFNDRILMAAAADVIDKWPDSFHTLLALRQSVQPTQSVRRDFGVVYSVLYRCLKEAEYQFLRNEFENFVNQHWQGILSKRNKAFSRSTLARHPRVTLKVAASKSKVTPSVLKRLGSAVSAAAVGTPQGRRLTTVETRRLQGVQGVTLQKASQLLHLSRPRVRKLLEVGVIKADISPVIYKAAAWFISLQQLQRLYFQNKGREAADAVLFGHIAKGAKLSADEFIGVVRALMAGELQTVNGVGNTIPLGQVCVSRAALKSWIHQFRMNNGLPVSVDEAARVLGIKQEVAYHLVRIGLLTSSPNPTNGNAQIHQKNLKVFQEQYVSLAQVAKDRGTSAKALRTKLMCSAVTGPDIDGGRQYFYRVADLDS